MIDWRMWHIMRPKRLIRVKIWMRHAVWIRRHVNLSIIMIIWLIKMEISRHEIVPRTPITWHIFVRISLIRPYKMIFSGLIKKLEIFYLSLFLNSHLFVLIFVIFVAILIPPIADFFIYHAWTIILILIRHLKRTVEIWIFARRNSMITVILRFFNSLFLFFLSLNGK